MALFRRMLALGMLASVPLAGLGQRLAHADAGRALDFELATEVLDESSVQVSNGVEVLASHWPSLIIARFTYRSILGPVKASCTAALVGPNVALMAAHCVDPREREAQGVPIRAQLAVGDRRIPFVCQLHPAYAARPLKFSSPRGSDDFALCLLDHQGMPPARLQGMRFEVVDTDTELIQGTAVLMVGYGCDRVRIVDGRLDWTAADGKLRVGEGRIDLATGALPGEAEYATIRSVQAASPALCPGDSGGPLFSGVDARHPDGHRRVRAVNSSILPDGQDLVSKVAATASPAFRAWAANWLREHAAHRPELCGVNLRAGERQCRD